MIATILILTVMMVIVQLVRREQHRKHQQLMSMCSLSSEDGKEEDNDVLKMDIDCECSWEFSGNDCDTFDSDQCFDSQIVKTLMIWRQ